MTQSELVLISMPFFDYKLPSAQISVIKAYLKEEKVNVRTIHAYIEFYKHIGDEYIELINNYSCAEYLFIKFAYPERYKRNRNQIEDRIISDLEISGNILEDLYSRIEKFINAIEKRIDMNCGIIAFSITYKQLLPSICLAKKIRNKNYSGRIIFGGSRVSGELGRSLVLNEPNVDTVISGEGEVVLLNYIRDYYENKYSGRYINKKYIEEEKLVNLDELPPPDYDDYLCELKAGGVNNKFIFLFYEVARGCWWNRCTFCSSQRIHKRYREKSPLKIANDLDIIITKYKVDRIWLLGDCYSFKSYMELSNILVDREIKVPLMIYSRCSTEFEYYQSIKKMGTDSLIVGIEAISDGLLKKMNKGINTIRNIQCLKYCAKVGLNCTYNLFYGYPNFTRDDFDETMSNMDYIMGFQPPESLCDMELQFGSPAFNNSKQFDIVEVLPDRCEQMILPENALTFLYEYDTIESHEKYSYKILDKVIRWNDLFQKHGFLTLTYRIYNELVEISDYRQIEEMSPLVYLLNEEESKVFIMCDKLMTRARIKAALIDVDVDEAIKKLVEKKILFVSGDECLAVPLFVEENS